MEGPDLDGGEIGESKRVGSGLGQWMRGQLSRTPSVSSMAHNSKRSDLRLLLGPPPSTSAPPTLCLTLATRTLPSNSMGSWLRQNLQIRWLLPVAVTEISST